MLSPGPQSLAQIVRSLSRICEAGSARYGVSLLQRPRRVRDMSGTEAGRVSVRLGPVCESREAHQLETDDVSRPETPNDCEQ